MGPENFFRKLAASALFCLLVAALPFCALAENWKASLHENGSPPSLVGVDKKRGVFNFFEKNSPLSLLYSYPCVTGQVSGDKQQLNDLRTPEGVYFVEYKIANGLDFREYGGIAYTLNYPNPVDRLRGKTGHGIWIHSKGFGLTPTRGCVAIDLRNIAEVGPRLTPGLPVVVAEELGSVNSFDDGVPAQLTSLMTSWTNAWAARSNMMFDYYDPEAYSKATENFDAFRQNKERLFKTLSFIKIYNRDIHALEGPGYWVTWAEQLYTASNLSTEGVRRLYWQKDKQGHFRIVGMEWIPRDLGMRADYLKGRLVAQNQPAAITDATSEAPRPPRLDMPEGPADTPAGRPATPLPAPTATQTPPAVAASIAIAALSDPLVPRRQLQAEQPDEIVWGVGRPLTEPKEASEQKKEPVTPEATPARVGETATPVPQPQETAPTKPVAPAKTASGNQENLVLDKATVTELNSLVDAWLNALRVRKPDDLVSLYNRKEFNRLPASAGINRIQSMNTHLQGLQREMKQPWLKVIARPARFSVNGPIAKSVMDVLFIGPSTSRQGEQTIWWHKNPEGQLQIVGQQFQPRPLGLEANYLEMVSNEISTMIENWRKAWETGRVDDYMEFYAPDAWQQGRAGAKNIRRQKEDLWRRVKPTLVQLSGLRLAMDGRNIRADMNQSYADSAGRTDKGVKTLGLRYDGANWLIQREDWTAQPAQVANGR